jgi:hypothetical protein
VVTVQRRRWELVPHTLMMPIYWVLISAAAYRAIWQLSSAPFLWEKTAHRARTRRATSNP